MPTNNLPTLAELADELANVNVPEFTAKFVRNQPAGPREFNVAGRKADAIRALIFADRGYTRKQIAAIADASVSRVGEVVWGLEHDAIEFPAIPLRETKVVEAEETEEVVSA